MKGASPVWAAADMELGQSDTEDTGHKFTYNSTSEKIVYLDVEGSTMGAAIDYKGVS
jgi:hypothetical protein